LGPEFDGRRGVQGKAEGRKWRDLGIGLYFFRLARRLRSNPPIEQVAGVQGDAEEICGDEAELGGANTDDADHGAVDSGDDPPLPEFLANQHSGQHGQNAG